MRPPAATERTPGVFAGISEIPADAWDAIVAPDEGPLRHAFLLAAESADLAAYEPRPIVHFGESDATILAHAPAYLYDLDSALFATGIAAQAIALARRAALPRLLLMRVLEVGCPVALGHPLSLAPGVRPTDGTAWIARAAIAEANAGAADLVVIRDFVRAPRDDAEQEVLARLGFDPVPLPPTFVLDLRRFGSFEEYLAAMRSPYRRRARLRLRAAESLRPDLIRDFAPLAPELARLWRAVYDRAREYRREVLPPRFFERIAGVPGAAVLAMNRPDGSLASFALLLEDGHVLRFLYSGSEQDAARHEGAYFRLLYEIVRLAIDGGFEEVELGFTTGIPKLDLGARTVPLRAWIRHRRPYAQRALAWAMRTMFAPVVPAPRHVFKRAWS